MSLGNILALAALAAPVLGLGYQYAYVHLPAFRAAEAETYYTRCLRECHVVCKANGVPLVATPDDPRCCNCDHCLKHLEGAE